MPIRSQYAGLFSHPSEKTSFSKEEAENVRRLTLVGRYVLSLSVPTDDSGVESDFASTRRPPQF